jgi:hypothetical protein
MIAVFMLPAIAPVARGAVIGVSAAGPPGIGRERAARASRRLEQAARQLSGGHAEALGLSPRGQPSPPGHRLAEPWQAPRRCRQLQEERKTS